MNANDQQLRPAGDGGPTTLICILAFGAAEVLILYLLLVLETPFSALARRAASTWPGRAMLALIGWVLISAFMIVLLTFLEKRRARSEGTRGA